MVLEVTARWAFGSRGNGIAPTGLMLFNPLRMVVLRGGGTGMIPAVHQKYQPVWVWVNHPPWDGVTVNEQHPF